MKKALQRLEKITAAATERMQEEVAALLGKSFTFTNNRTKLASKEDIFDALVGKMVMAHADLEGELEGAGCMLVPLKDGIRIGGTLIMLPETELAEVAANEDYTEEIEDSFGEIANIISGSLTTSFEENHPKSFRVVRKTQEVIAPAKVDIASDDPVPDGMYFHLETAMQLDGEELGDFHLLLPGIPFGLVEDSKPDVQEAPEESKEQTATAANQTEGGAENEAGTANTEEGGGQTAGEESASTAAEASEAESEAPSAKKKDPIKIKKKVDKLFAICGEQIGTEVGALLGGELKLVPKEICFNTKEEILDRCTGKQILARMDVRGDSDGESYLFSTLKDAIFLGGTLIMLPDSELEETVRNDEFGADAEDAYGEITNIIAGVYTAVFEEQFSKNLGFVKTGLETIKPAKIDPESDDTFPEQPYYLQSVLLTYNDKELGDFLAVFPTDIFDITSLAPSEAAAEAEAAKEAAKPREDAAQEEKTLGTASKDNATDFSGSQSSGKSSDAGSADIPNVLVIGEDGQQADAIGTVLQQFGYTPKILSFGENAHNYLPGEIELVFLVMEHVSEKGFAETIKVSSAASSIPLVAAGPAWTRTTVLKAVKYGADDILITPASESDIREKIDAHLGQVAA